MSTVSVNKAEAEIGRFEAYVKADPKNTVLWTNLGDLYHGAGRLEEAIASYEKCLMLDEQNWVARGRLANVLITQHRFDEAERMVRGILEQTGEDPVLLHNLGLALFYQRRFDEARRAFEHARDRGLRSASNVAYIVYALHKKNDTAQALKAAQTWLEQSPGPASEGYVAMLELDHGDMDAALARAEDVLREQPANPDANVVLGTWHLEQQQAAEAMAHYERVVRSEPDNPRGWQGIGLVHMHRGDFGAAIEALQKVSEGAGGATTHLIIGWAKLANGDARGAEDAFREAIGANRSFGEAHGGLAAALVFQHRLDEAKAEIKTARRLDPGGFGAVFAQSVSLKVRGKGDQSTALLAGMLEQSPLPRSKPLIEHIRDHVRAHGSASTHVREQNGSENPK